MKVGKRANICVWICKDFAYGKAKWCAGWCRTDRHGHFSLQKFHQRFVIPQCISECGKDPNTLLFTTFVVEIFKSHFASFTFDDSSRCIPTKVFEAIVTWMLKITNKNNNFWFMQPYFERHKCYLGRFWVTNCWNCSCAVKKLTKTSCTCNSCTFAALSLTTPLKKLHLLFCAKISLAVFAFTFLMHRHDRNKRRQPPECYSGIQSWSAQSSISFAWSCYLHSLSFPKPCRSSVDWNWVGWWSEGKQMSSRVFHRLPKTKSCDWIERATALLRKGERKTSTRAQWHKGKKNLAVWDWSRLYSFFKFCILHCSCF